jgi:hypothetical protein
MRRQQICDILKWCGENIEADNKEACDSLQESIMSDSIQQSKGVQWLLNKSIGNFKLHEQGRHLLNVKPWDLAQYLAIYDYFYISHMLANASVEDLLAPIARDDVTILSNPDLRTEQVYPPTMTV